MFWGLSLKANKKYTQQVLKAFHVSQAALDIGNSSAEPIQVILTWEKTNYILCTLRRDKIEQVALDLNFAEGDEISFTAQGNGNVHLVGYFVVNADETEDSDVDFDVSAKENESSGVEKKNKILESAQSQKEYSEKTNEDGQPSAKRVKISKSLTNGKDEVKEKVIHNSKTKERNLEAGVKIIDKLIGTGQEACSGKKVQVYYEGRLKSNNKIFDSLKQGSGFKFVLGRGEVIKGWDIGVLGMKLGGIRKIICPPNAAYGAKGSPPVIPPNSTLVFEVELKSVR